MVNQLTARQRQVAELIQKGMSNKEIARVLNIANGTVKVHVYDMFQRLGVTSRTKLMSKLIKSSNGLMV